MCFCYKLTRYGTFFLETIKGRLWQKSRNELLIFTDGMDGLNHEHQPITKRVKREDVLLKHEIKEEIYQMLDCFFEEDRSFFLKPIRFLINAAFYFTDLQEMEKQL